MYKTKEAVDAYAHSELSQILSLTERHLHSFSIAKLYYEIKEFATAEQYLCSYLSVKEDNDQAHKLLGQCYQHLKKPDKALESFQRSLQLNPKQSDVLDEAYQLLLEDKNLSTNKAKYWCELAESEKVKDEVVLSLRLKLMKLGTNQVEELIEKEIAARPNDVQLRVRLVRNYVEKNQILDAFKYVHQLEMSQKDEFVTSSEWYNVVWLVLNKYEQMPNTKKDWDFWLLLVMCLERQVQISISLPSKPTSLGDGVTETENLLFNLDQYLFKISQLSDEFCAQKELVELFLDHYRGQLLLHATALIFKRLGRFHNKSQWKDSTRIVLPLMLLAYQIAPSNKKQLWMKHCDKHFKQLITLWQREGSFRCAQVGRTLLSCVDDNAVDNENAHNINNLLSCQTSGLWQNNDELLNHVRKTCSDRQWRSNIFALLFYNSGQNAKEQSSLFAKSSKLSEPIYEMPSYAEVECYEDTAQYFRPQSLQHMVYLCLGNENLAYVKAKYFSGLNYSTQNLSFCGAESLNQLDVDSFLYAATIQAKRALEVTSSALGKPKLLPFVNIHNMLCTKEQSQWWSAAYIVYKNLSSGNDLEELRANLQYGIEAVRGINGPKLDMAIVFKLGQIFVARAQDIVKPVEKAYLEARAESIYKYGLNMMKMHNKGVLEPIRKYFKYVKSQTPAGDCALASAAEDAVSYLATRYLQKSEYEDLIEQLSGVQLPFATYLKAEAYRKLNEASTTTKKSKRLYLDHANECVNQTLALHKSSTYSNSDHLLQRSIMPSVCMSNTTRSRKDTSSATPMLPSQNQEIETPIKQIVNTLTIFKDDVMNNFKLELQNISKEICILKDKISIPEEAMTKITPWNEDLYQKRQQASTAPHEGVSQNRNNDESITNVLDMISNSPLMSQQQYLQAMIPPTKNYLLNFLHNHPYHPNSYLITPPPDGCNDRAGILPSLTHLDPAVPVSSATVNLSMPTGVRVESNRPSVINITSLSSSTTPLTHMSTSIPAFPTTTLTTIMQFHKLLNNKTKFDFNLSAASSLVSLTAATQWQSFNTKPSFEFITSPAVSTSLLIKSNKQLSSTKPPATGKFDDAFKLKAGSWTCQGCNLTNSADALNCKACYDHKDHSVPKPNPIEKFYFGPLYFGATQSDVADCSSAKSFKFTTPSTTSTTLNVSFIPKGDEVMFYHRARLFHIKDMTWNDCSIGDITILKGTDGTSRIIIRSDQSLKICANHIITHELRMNVSKSKTKGFIWTANDFPEGSLQLKDFHVYFKSATNAHSFQTAFINARKEAKRIQSAMPVNNEEKSKVTLPSTSNTRTHFALTKSTATNLVTSTRQPKNEYNLESQTQTTTAAATASSNVNSAKSKAIPATAASPFANFTFKNWCKPSGTSSTSTTTISPTVASETGAAISNTFVSISTQFKKNLKKIRKEAKVKQSAIPGKNLEKSKVTSPRKFKTGRRQLAKSRAFNFVTSTSAPRNENSFGSQTQNVFGERIFAATTASSSTTASTSKPLFSDLNFSTKITSSNVNSANIANFTFRNWSMPSCRRSTSTTTISPTVASETGAVISNTFVSISTQFEENLKKIRNEAKVKQSALPGKNLEKSKVTSTRKSNTGRHSTLGKSRAINFVTSSPAPSKTVYSLGSGIQKVFGKSNFAATATGASITASTFLSSDLNLSTKISSSNVNSAKPTALATSALACLFSTAKGSTDFRNLTTKSSSNASQSLDKTGVSGGFLFGSATSTTSAGESIFGGPKDSKSTFGEKPAIFGGAAAVLNSSSKGSTSSGDTTSIKSIFGANGTTSSSIFVVKPVFGSALPSCRSSVVNDANKSIFGSSGNTSQSAGNGTRSSLFGSSINTSGFSSSIFGSSSTNLPQFGSLTRESNPVGTTFADLSKKSTAATDFSNLTTKSNSNASQSLDKTSISFADLSKTATASIDFASLAKANTNTNLTPNSNEKSGFIGLTNQNYFSSFGKPLNGLDSLYRNSSASKTNESQKGIDGGGEGTGDSNDENCSPHYVSVIELPNKAMFGTPEENETKLFGERAFLFRWDATTEQNKESGVGELKILLHPVKRNYRMVMRCVQIDKLVLNHSINADFHFDNMSNNPKGFVWESPNYAESNEGELEKLAVRFCKLEIAEAFSKKLRECIDNCKER